MIMNYGSGGGSLDFKVVGGTTQPSSPRNKTIWVNTAAEITGYVFSATPPTPSQGVVWFQTSTAAPAAFTADRKNTVYVYPIRCAQYVNGLWVQQTAQSYLNGAWVDWDLYVFKEFYGPAADFSVTSYFTSQEVAGAVTDQMIRLKSTYADNGQRGLSSKAMVTLTDYNRVCFEVIANTANVKLGIAHTKIFWNTALLRSTGDIPIYRDIRKTVSIDVSELVGNFYIGGNNGADATTDVTIFNIWCE